jgi:tetratricopeptide (TPR) repeat protein
LAAVCLLVIWIYAYMSLPGDWEKFGLQNAADSCYNLLVQGFRAGQLSLNKEVPVGLTQLADPYDPAANEVYRGPPYFLHDLCYYKGHLYLYHGVTPALILFWPYTVLTGKYLSHRPAVTIFCVIGFLVSVGLLRAVWRRYFAEVSVGVVVACAVALGLATGVLAQLTQASFYQVARTCAYMLTMLALGGIWCAVHEPERGWRWLAAASAAYGLAVGARPNLVFGAVVLLVPVARAWRERRPVWAVLAAATVPITLVGLGLMLYNELRFDNPFEFGWRYQLNVDRQITRQAFSSHFLWFNFRVYFLEPARWSARFPFVHEAPVPPSPAGYTQVTKPFGVLANIPLTWLALAAPLAWRGRSGQTASVLRWFVAATALLFGTCAFTLGLHCASSFDYEMDFLPSLLLLAVIGILGLERALTNRPVWRRAARCGWGVLLGFSVAFNLLATTEHCAEAHTIRGDDLGVAGRHQEAIEQYEQALRIEPDYARAHNNLGHELRQTGKIEEAIAHLQQALRIKPDLAEAHNNLGLALGQAGRMEEAIAHFEQALRIKPDYAEAHNNLGTVLGQAGRIQEAIAHFEQALRLKPDYAEAHYNLGVALAQTGKIEEAIGHYVQAVRIKPDDAEAHNNLGTLFLQKGRVSDAIGHYEQALRIKPDYAEAHSNLGNVLLREGKVSDAIAHCEQALRIKPDFAKAHNNLGNALMRSGRMPEAIEHLEQAVRIKPDYAEARCNLGIALEKAGRVQEAIAQYEQALRIKPDFTEAQNALARLQAGQ